jgi:hypothetical protein
MEEGGYKKCGYLESAIVKDAFQQIINYVDQ